MNIKNTLFHFLQNPGATFSKFKNDPGKYILCFIRSEVFLYLLFGVLTTVENLTVYYALTIFLNVYYMTSEIIAWITAVIFAYLTNRKYVFKSISTGRSHFNEAWKFLSGRLITLVMEAGMLKILVSVLGFSEKSLTVKIVPAVFVIVSNYFLSKLIIFKKR